MHRNSTSTVRRLIAVSATAALLSTAAVAAHAAEMATDGSAASSTVESIVTLEGDVRELAAEAYDVAADDDQKLKPGERLKVGEVMKSKNGAYGFFVSNNGNVYHFKYTGQNTGNVIWHANTNNVKSVVFTDKGRLHLLDGNGKLVARTNNPLMDDASSARLVLKNDGSLTIRDAKDIVWRTSDGLYRVNNNGGGDNSSTNTLTGGNELKRGQHLLSNNGRYSARINDNGAFVVRDLQAEKQIWNAGARGGQKVIMRNNGNVVLLDSDGDKIWETATAVNNARNPRMIMRNNGVLEVMHGDRVVWRSTGGNDGPGDGDNDNDNRNNTITPSNPLTIGDVVTSANGEFTLRFTEYGAPVLTRTGNSVPLWFPIYNKLGYGTSLNVGRDGNATISGPLVGQLWETGTAANNPKNPRMVLQNSGKLVLLHGNQIVWSS